MGGGSWATALAKIVLSTQDSINWYMRRQDQVDDFIKQGITPVISLPSSSIRTKLILYRHQHRNRGFRHLDFRNTFSVPETTFDEGDYSFDR